MFLLVLLLIGLNILVFTKASFIFTPFIVLVETIALPVVLTGVVYYLLNPIVDFLERKNVKRIYSILLLYIVIIGLITILIVSVIPLLREQITSLVDNFPRYVHIVEDQIKQLIGSQFFNQVQQTLNINLTDLASKLSDQATTILNSTFTGVGTFIGAVTEVVISIVTVPFILFYLLKDGKKTAALYFEARTGPLAGTDVCDDVRDESPAQFVYQGADHRQLLYRLPIVYRIYDHRS